MNDMTPTRDQREAALEGMGCKRKRVEDIRFTQGKGNYVDDLKLPGMLHGDFVRSPHAHARIRGIDASRAAALPGMLLKFGREMPNLSSQRSVVREQRTDSRRPTAEDKRP